MAVGLVIRVPSGPDLRRTCAEEGLGSGLRTVVDVRVLDPVALVWLRLGSSEHLLHVTVQHLGGRRVGERLLVHDPVVRTQVADAVCEQLVVAAELSGLGDVAADPPPSTLSRLHRAVTDVDRSLLRLLGARSFLVDGPGADAMLSERLRDLVATGRAAEVSR